MGHGKGGGGGFVSELVDGAGTVGAKSALALVGQIQDHTKKTTLVGDSGNGADFAVEFGAVNNLLAEVGPGDQAGKALVYFLEGFRSEGSGSIRGGRRWVGAIADGLIQLLEGPIGDDFYRAAVGSIVLEHWTCRMGLGKGARVHETTSWNIGVRLTLGFSEN